MPTQLWIAWSGMTLLIAPGRSELSAAPDSGLVTPGMGTMSLAMLPAPVWATARLNASAGDMPAAMCSS